jgi:glycosyltransferase involved in cell wall biosynthesis
MKVCAIIPAFNEAEALGRVIKGIRAFGVDAIIVDDGSTDETSLVAEKNKAHVLRNLQRSGKGFSLRVGFDYALKHGYDMVFTIDGDGQHDPCAIPMFLDKIKKGGRSVVVGNRMNNPKDMPIVRVITNRFMSSVISGICGQYIADTQCGYRLFTSDAIAGIDIRSRKFEIESEILVKLSRAGFRIDSVSVKSIYADEKSKIRPVRDSFRFLRFVLDMIFKK